MSARLALAVAAVSAAADDMDTVRQRARQAFGWPAANTISTVVDSARELAATLNSTCYWPDIDYYGTGRAVWGAFTHVDNVATLVQALTVPGSPVFEDPTLTAAAHCALAVWLNCSWKLPGNQPGCINSNWWYQWIGTELRLQGVFMNWGVNRTSAWEQEQLTQMSYNSAWWVNPWGGGANLVWMITVEIERGVATSNSTALFQGFDTMWANVAVGNVTDNWQGIVADMSYHFHGQQILNSAYGLDWVISILQFWQVAVGTQWAMPAEKVAILAQFLAEGDALLSYGGAYDWGTQGRGIDRPVVNFAWGIQAELINALAQDPGAAPWKAQLQRFATVANGGVAPGAWYNSMYFWTSDFYVHHRSGPNGAGWGASLKMHGDNGQWTVVQNECDNSENLLAEHTGDGVLNVYSGDGPTTAVDAYGFIFPVLDWNAINGITVEHDKPIEPCDASTGDVWAERNTAFVGGVSDGMYGAAVMDTWTHNTTAQRSWFFLDTAIVAIASNLTNNYGSVAVPGDVWTTLMSRKLANPSVNPDMGTVTVAYSNGTTSVLSDGSHTWSSAAEVAWFVAGGIGVIPAVRPSAVAPGLPVQSSAPVLGVTVGNKTGDWATIGAYTGTVNYRTITAYLDHGVSLPAGSAAAAAGYVYLLAPNQTASTMPGVYAQGAGVTCTQAQADVHGVTQGRVSAAAFWAPNGGTYACAAAPNGGVTLSTSVPALVLFTEGGSGQGGTISVTVSHPTQLGGSISVTVSRVAHGPGCSAGGRGAPGTTVFTVPMPVDPNLLGSSTTITCAQ